MLRSIWLAAVAAAIVALAAHSVQARGGRGHSGYGYGYYYPGYYYYPSGGMNSSSNYRGSSSGSTRRSHANATSTSSVTSNAPSTGLGATASTGTGTGNSSSGTSTAGTTKWTHSAANQSTTSTNPNGVSLQSPLQPTITVSPFAISPYSVSLDPNTQAQNMYGALLNNAKQLIKAGIYSGAAADLQRIINGVPGTRIANEAQRLLASLPTF
jgi:TolA-binding protein